MKKEDLIGVRFGKLKVIEESKERKSAWVCKCDCGNITISLAYNLKSGKSSSCGCKRKETLSNIFTTHGYSKTRLYRIYKGMKQRCYNANTPSFKHYGGKGITICQEWLDDFSFFSEWALKNNYNDEMSIDRINPNKGYFPENCRWVNMHTQQNNKLNNIFLKIGDERLTISEWSEKNKSNKQTLYSKFYRLFEQLRIENKNITEFEIKIKNYDK